LGEDQRRRKTRRGFQSPLPQKKETKHGNSNCLQKESEQANKRKQIDDGFFLLSHIHCPNR
jgi:hypothetical protein